MTKECCQKWHGQDVFTFDKSPPGRNRCLFCPECGNKLPPHHVDQTPTMDDLKRQSINSVLLRSLTPPTQEELDAFDEDIKEPEVKPSIKFHHSIFWIELNKDGSLYAEMESDENICFTILSKNQAAQLRDFLNDNLEKKECHDVCEDREPVGKD